MIPNGPSPDNDIPIFVPNAMKLDPGPCTGALDSTRVMPGSNTDRNEGLLEKPRLSD